ncbi:peptidase M20 domain-containing protein 2 [Aplysia californica]|uniref:Peptidase M20 domain-containing protein 2 n=1 Tax=Aplysia californica TaxID=6500 RepID=A0ABM0K6W2_APLCA|nr:peptidase M20 domain-containing protein 2 [Aplysia californica]
MASRQVDLEALKSRLYRVACEKIASESVALTRVSRALWENPELGLQEKQAEQLLSSFLLSRDFPVIRHHVLPTAFLVTHPDDAQVVSRDVTDGDNDVSNGSVSVGSCVGNLESSGITDDVRESATPASDDVKHQAVETRSESRDVSHVAVFCEYDALPDIGHACGHNLIAVVGLATGLGIAAAIDAAWCENVTLGKLSIIGSPDEENTCGKVNLLKAGVLEGVDFSLMAHPAMSDDATPNFSGCYSCFAIFKGTGGSSMNAWYGGGGGNALDAACLAYQSVACLRQQFRPDWRFHATFKSGGVHLELVPERVVIEIYYRANRLEELRELESKIFDAFRGAATACGCSVEYEMPYPKIDPLISNDSLVAVYTKHAAALGVNLPQAWGERDPVGCTDMGNVSQVVPSIHPVFDIGTDSVLHTRDFAAAAGTATALERSLQQAKVLAMTAIDVMLTPSVVRALREDAKRLREKNVQS